MIFNESIYNKDWPIKKLSQLGVFSRGVSKHRPRDDARLFIDGDIPFLQTGEVKSARLYVDSYSAKYNNFGLSQSKLWKKGTLCITIAANIAESAILSKDMCFPDSIVGFVPNDNETTSEYMYYIFEYIKSQIQSRTNGSIQDNINIDYLKDLEFRISPHQGKIKKVLSDIDNKILLNHAIIDKLESMAKTIYDYWFVQFDFPDENGHPYKTSGGKMEWNETLSREIPAGWEVKKIKEIADVIAGGDKPEEYSAIKTEKYTVPIYTNGVDKDGLYGYCEAGRVNEDSITIGARGNIGYTKFRQGGYLPIIRLISVTPKDQRYLEYLGFILKEYPYRKNGSVQNQLPVPDVEDIMIVVPDVSLVEKYHEQASLCLNKYYLIKDEMEELCSLRDFLLPMLMNGQVTFRQ